MEDKEFEELKPSLREKDVSILEEVIKFERKLNKDQQRDFNKLVNHVYMMGMEHGHYSSRNDSPYYGKMQKYLLDKYNSKHH